MGFSGPLEDRLAIRELIDRYNDGVTCLDVDEWRSTWAEDAEWELMGHRIAGRDAIVAVWQQTMSQMEFVGFQTAPGSVEITGRTATGRALATEVLKPKDGERRHVFGRYDDTYVKVGDEWFFQTRRYQVLAEYGG